MIIFGKEFKNVTTMNIQELGEWFKLSNTTNPRNIGEVTFYTCLKTLSDKVASIPCGVYSSPDGISSKYENHYLNYLLQTKPNPYQNAPIFWSSVEKDRNYYGNSFVYMETVSFGRNAGKISGLWQLPSSEIRILVDDIGIFGTNNALWYIWTDSRTGKPYKFSSNQVLHFKNWLTEDDGIRGKSVKDILASYIETSQESNNYINKLVKNGMVTDKIVLQYTGDMGDKAKTALVQNVESYSVSNSGKYIPLPANLEVKNLASKLVDSQFLDLSKYTALQIASAFGIPPSYLNNLDKANYANVGILHDGLYRDTLLPIFTQYECELECKALPQFEKDKGFFFYFDVDVILRANITDRANAYTTYVAKGVMTINEARSKENLAPVEGGDEILVQGANTTLNNVIKGVNYNKNTGQGGGNTDE